MKPIAIDEIRALLPEVNELRPLMERILVLARSDTERRWAASGELGTVGERLLDPDDLRKAVPEVLETLLAHLSIVYGHMVDAVAAAARGDKEGALEALLAAAQAEHAAGRLSEAEAFVAAALALVPSLSDGRAALPALLTGARIARALGDWSSAEERYLQALKMASDADDPSRAATAAMGWGNLAVDRGLWDEADDRYEAAGTWVRLLPGQSPQAWHLALNRSIVRRESGRLSEAEGLLNEAEALAAQVNEGAGDPGAQAILLNARGQLLAARGRSGDAELAFGHALEHAESPDAQVTIGINLAETLLVLGRTLAAGEEARRAEERAIRGGVVLRLPEVYRTLGRVASARGHPDAFVFLERALEVIRDRRLPEFERAQTLEAYGELALDRGDEAEGRGRLEEAAEIYETLGCRTTLARIRALLERKAPPGAGEE